MENVGSLSSTQNQGREISSGNGILNLEQVLERLKLRTHAYHKNYLAMYSSWYGGIVTDPILMSVPMDDHMVHRGDGVFEAIRCAGGNIYMLNRHLDRLWTSAERVQLTIPMDREEMSKTIVETVRAAGQMDSVIRLYVSRGPGSFTPNPYESVQAQLYIMITALNMAASDERYHKGVSMMTSKISVKEGIFATVKSCNYLPNVLM